MATALRRHRSHGVVRPVGALAAVLVAVALLAGCASSGGQGGNVDPEQVDAVETPTLGACRDLAPADIGAASNATRTVGCGEPHTAQTYAVGPLPDSLDDAAYDDAAVGAFAYETCTEKLQDFLGADVSLSLRSLLTWAWFRPSQEAWDDGARWYRCDVVGGTEQSTDLPRLPETAQGLLQGRPDDRWLTCAAGPSIADAPRVPCAEPHRWRAATTIKVGEAEDDYPGDEIVRNRTRGFCRDSVRAYLGYPVDFEYSYTWFHRTEWDFGNRRSICWARTED